MANNSRKDEAQSQFKKVQRAEDGKKAMSEATAITDATCEKMVLMLLATPGITAPAATATKPAISAYSIRS